MKLTAIKYVPVFLLALSFILFAQEKSLLKRTQEKFSQADNFTVDFRIKENNSKGKFIFSKEFGEKLIYSGYEILVKADTIINFNKKLNRIVISLRENGYTNFSLHSILFEIPKHCKITESKNKITLIPEFPEDEGFKEMEVILNNKLLPQKVKVIDLNDNITSVVLSNYNFNLLIKQSDFILPKNSKTKIIDLR